MVLGFGIRVDEKYRSGGIILPASSGVPSLSTNEVARVAPLDGVLATLSHSVHSRATTIRPPRVEVPVVGALTVGGVLASLQNRGHIGIFALIEEVERTGNDAGDSCRSKKNSLEGNHGGLR